MSTVAIRTARASSVGAEKRGHQALRRNRSATLSCAAPGRREECRATEKQLRRTQQPQDAQNAGDMVRAVNDEHDCSESSSISLPDVDVVTSEAATITSQGEPELVFSSTVTLSEGSLPVSPQLRAQTPSECGADRSMAASNTTAGNTVSADSSSSSLPVPSAVQESRCRKRDSRIYCDVPGGPSDALEPVYHEIVGLKFGSDAVTDANLLLVFRLFHSDVRDGVFSGRMHATPVALQGEPRDAAVSPRGIIAVATRETLTLLHMETKESCPPDHYRVVGRLQVPWGADVTHLRFTCKARLEVGLTNGTTMVLGTQRVRNTYMEHTDDGDCKGCLRRSVCGCVGYTHIRDKWAPLHDMRDCEVNTSEPCRCDDCKNSTAAPSAVIEAMAATVADPPTPVPLGPVASLALGATAAASP